MAAQFHNVDFASSADHETFLGLRRISGTKIVAQSPPGCIVPEGAGPQRKPCLFDFDVMQEYIIPRKAFFNRFVAVNEPEGKYTVLGLPVAIAHPKYQRNEFIFNFGLVVVRLPAHSAAPHPVLSCPVSSQQALERGRGQIYSAWRSALDVSDPRRARYRRAMSTRSPTRGLCGGLQSRSPRWRSRTSI